jgi:hypothetical protein
VVAMKVDQGRERRLGVVGVGEKAESEQGAEPSRGGGAREMARGGGSRPGALKSVPSVQCPVPSHVPGCPPHLRARPGAPPRCPVAPLRCPQAATIRVDTTRSNKTFGMSDVDSLLSVVMGVWLNQRQVRRAAHGGKQGRRVV